MRRGHCPPFRIRGRHGAPGPRTLSLTSPMQRPGSCSPAHVGTCQPTVAQKYFKTEKKLQERAGREEPVPGPAPSPRAGGTNQAWPPENRGNGRDVFSSCVFRLLQSNGGFPPTRQGLSRRPPCSLQVPLGRPRRSQAAFPGRRTQAEETPLGHTAGARLCAHYPRPRTNCLLSLCPLSHL